MHIQFSVRVTEHEKSAIEKLAKSFGMSTSDYIKHKLFDYNSDLLDQTPKYVIPDISKHSYFLALSQMKIMTMFAQLFEKLNLMTKDQFKLFEKESSAPCHLALERLGYKKLAVNTEANNNNSNQNNNDGGDNE